MTIQQNLKLTQGLAERVSFPRLQDPAPSSEQMALCYQAAFRAPDHAWLRPWRFVECSGDARVQLGALLEEAMLTEVPDMPEEKRLKLRNGPLRAPLVVICYADITEHPKVPTLEQLLAAGCAANNLISAVYGLGYGAVWRSGAPAQSRAVHRALGLSESQSIIGFLYIGTPSTTAKTLPHLTQTDYVCSLSEHLSR